MGQDFRWVRDRGLNGHKEKQDLHFAWALFAVIIVFVTSTIIAVWGAAVIGEKNPHGILCALIIPISVGLTLLYLKNNYNIED